MKTPLLGSIADSGLQLARFLRDLGCGVVLIAEDTAVPGSLAQAREPVLVLIEEHLPRLDATEVCKQLRNCCSHGLLFLVVLTDRRAPHELVAIYEAGADECVTRPWSPEVLHASLAARLRSRRRHLRIEEFLRASRQHLRQVLDHAPFGGHFYHLDANRNLVLDDFNPAAERILAVPHQPLMGASMEEGFPGVFGSELCDICRVIAVEGGSWFQQRTLRTAERIQAVLEVHAFRPAEGHVAVFFMDVLERKLAEEALADSRERLAVTLRSIVDGVITTDLEGRVLTLNPAAERLVGWSMAEALGHPVDEVVVIVDEMTGAQKPCAVGTALLTGIGTEPGPPALLHPRVGEPPLVEQRAAPLLDDGGHAVGVVLVLTDVTERHRIMENLQRAERLDSLGILAGGIAHDFNNLLSGVFGYIEMARASLPQASGAQARCCLDKASDAFERARALTRQLLTFSKDGTPVRKPASIATLLLENASFALSGSKVTCEFELPDALWPCSVDEHEIGQVIHNLVLNAIQAMPDGGEIRIRAANKTSEEVADSRLLEGEAFVEFEVRDQGAGIPAELLPRIFDPFVTTKETGSGLGLATCHSIMRRHGGRIEAESLPGRGTTFRLLLPAAPGARVERVVVAPVHHSGSGRVLVLDDQEIIRSLLRDLLHSMGYEATCVARGRDAINAFAHAQRLGQSFHVVIVDLTIPGDTDCLAVVGSLRQASPGVRIVVSSGYANDPAISDPVSHGFSASLCKPYRMQELAAVMARVMRASS